jgi:hypothetical protein
MCCARPSPQTKRGRQECARFGPSPEAIANKKRSTPRRSRNRATGTSFPTCGRIKQFFKVRSRHARLMLSYLDALGPGWSDIPIWVIYARVQRGSPQSFTLRQLSAGGVKDAFSLVWRFSQILGSKMRVGKESLVVRGLDGLSLE